MRKEFSHQRALTRRMMLFGGAQGLLLGALLSRLYYLQFLKADEFTTQAEDNRIKLQLMSPPRGQLQDRFGVPFATNQVNYRVVIEPDTRQKLLDILDRLRRIVPLSDAEYDEARTLITTTRVVSPLTVKEYLSWDELTRVEFHFPELPGAFIEQGQHRHYPYGELAAHVIGYVGRVSEKEMTDQPLFRLPDFKIGKNGVEQLLERQIQGTPGMRQLEVNAKGLQVRELRRQESVPGETIKLSLDARLQEYTAQRLTGESGAVVVMDVHTGELLTLVSMPGFDPNRFSVGIRQDYWNELNANEKNPLLNKAISGQYPPGSTFKMVVGLAGLKSGKFEPHDRVHCPGHFYLGNHRFNCWKPEGHGAVDLHQAIAVSCDTYFYTVAQRAGIDAIAEMARRFGLGSLTHVGITGEKAGLVPDPVWKDERYNQRWNPGDTINVGIGQGYILATPIQLAVMAARIANGGRKVLPRLTIPAPEEVVPLDQMEDIGVDPEHMKLVQLGMHAATNEPYGTAYARRILDPRFAMAGKTGTSQVRRIVQRGMNQALLPWNQRHHALYVGYAPDYAPRFAIAVLVEHGGGGSAAAAPVARDVMQKLQELYAV